MSSLPWSVCGQASVTGMAAAVADAAGPISAIEMQQASAKRASVEEIDAVRQRLRYSEVCDGECIRAVQVKNDCAVWLWVGHGSTEGHSLWHVSDLFDEGRAREVYTMWIKGGQECLVLKLEKKDVDDRQSHAERVFLVDLQMKLGVIPSFVARCYWSGQLYGRDATVWEYAQPSFGVLVQRLCKKWQKDVAFALFAGCFAMAREVVAGLREGIFYGDMHMDNMWCRWRRSCSGRPRVFARPRSWA